LAAFAVTLLAAPLVLLVLPSSPAGAHGHIIGPPSRQEHCAARRVSNCGGLEYEPQSVEAPKGSRLCSGGSRFTVLDDESKGWPVTAIGRSTTFQWRLTANHRTSTWEYYVDGRLFKTFNDGGAQPPSNIAHRLDNLPTGRHKILAIWNIFDTAMAFYNCIDVQIGTGGPPPPPPPPPGSCPSPAWDRGAVYVAGNTVSHAQHEWRAKWWTQGEEPGTTGQWGVWQDLGAC
jgi:predicted carbohydrate-binding protein with CBM5 and CBM33 domain